MSFPLYADVLISKKSSTAFTEFQCNLKKRYGEINIQYITTKLCPFLGVFKVEVYCVNDMKAYGDVGVLRCSFLTSTLNIHERTTLTLAKKASCKHSDPSYRGWPSIKEMLSKIYRYIMEYNKINL